MSPHHFPHFVDDRKRIEEILALLEVEDELALRADLAVELVREASIIQDSLERGLYPFLEERGATTVVQQMHLSSEHVREAMRPVYDAARHVTPSPSMSTRAIRRNSNTTLNASGSP